MLHALALQSAKRIIDYLKQQHRPAQLSTAHAVQANVMHSCYINTDNSHAATMP